MFHDLDHESDEFYNIALQFAICPEFSYVAYDCEVEIKLVRALSKDKEFLELVEDIKKGFGDKDPFTIKAESNRLKVLSATTKNALNEKNKNQQKAIDSFFAITQDIKKGVKTDAPKGNSIKLQISEEKYEDTKDEFGEENKKLFK